LRAEILKIKAERNPTIVYVTHDSIDVRLMADRIAVLHEGKVIQLGSYDELRSSPKSRIVSELSES